MGWFASLFSPSSSSSSRRGQAMSTTHDAFSLPTSSPILPSQPYSFPAESLGTPDPESSTSSTYTYPPPNSAKYGYFPSSAGPSQPTSLLPMHHDPLHTPFSPSGPYPPLAKTWSRLRAWLSHAYPELGDTLNYGILPQDLANIEMQFGFALPAVIRESYLAVDGQEPESSAGCSEGLFFGLALLPLEDVLEEWRFWREVDEDPATGGNPRLREVMQSLPATWVRKEYSQRGWIPLITDKAGNYAGVDLNPAEGGSVGQVIVFGRDFDTKVVLWNGDGPSGWARWLASFVDELENGEGFEIGVTNEHSDDSEDDVGFESYFNDGTADGGDSSSGGGMRLTGEYKGWSVLEAWADRSIRKWYDAGVIEDGAILPEGDIKANKTEAENVGLGVIDLVQTGAAEVEIPVIGDPPNTQSVHARNASKIPPTISITKPPAPLPVDLPTQRDIVTLPSPPESVHADYQDDLEAGNTHSMRELPSELETGLVSNVRRSPKAPSPVRTLSVDDAGAGNSSVLPVAVPLPITPIVQPKASIAERLSPPPDIPDLLADSAPAMQAVPIEPSPADPLAVSPQEIIEPEPTIRLVGGGGSVGVSDSQPELAFLSASPPPQELDNTDAGSVISVGSTDSAAADAGVKKHKKSKSGGLAGLKKFGGKLRNKGSMSSTKEKEVS
ncbi:hypothetical protein HGRIS_013551 [Hohenbuehelia grisea]|uniref:Knr4/Smi1-like domain-containing protein n=1 Tax=Hohenbuehelia grisea TaxID=104357 RepID=A0ABR3IVZ3_9AGAR